MRRVSVGTLLGRRDPEAWAVVEEVDALALHSGLPKVCAGNRQEPRIEAEPSSRPAASIRLPESPAAAPWAVAPPPEPREPEVARGRSPPEPEAGTSGGDAPWTARRGGARFGPSSAVGAEEEGRGAARAPRPALPPLEDVAPPSPELLDCSPLPPVGTHCRHEQVLESSLDEFETLLETVKRENSLLKRTAHKVRRKSLNMDKVSSEPLGESRTSRGEATSGVVTNDPRLLRRMRRKSAPVLQSLGELQLEQEAFAAVHETTSLEALAEFQSIEEIEKLAQSPGEGPVHLAAHEAARAIILAG